MTITNADRAKLYLYANLQDTLVGGCGDGGCIVKRQKGQHTNGGCKCLLHPTESEIIRMRQMIGVAGPLADSYRAALDEIDRLRADRDQGAPWHWNTNMDEAPKDRPILLWNDPDHKHPNCGYCGTLADETRGSLCLYHAHAEGLSAHPQIGPVVGCWGGGWDDRTYEEPTAGWLPDWWFLDDSTDEIALNPVAWMEVPNFAAPAEGDNE